MLTMSAKDRTDISFYNHVRLYCCCKHITLEIQDVLLLIVLRERFYSKLFLF